MLGTVSRFLSVLALVAFAAAASAGEKPLTVVELYTSQGCSSCPPADAYLGKLKERDGILALSFHVDYWDYIGWKDPYALPANTQRQRAYAKHLGMGYVYTPQMVVQGMAHTTGSDKGNVERLIRDVRGAKRLDVEASTVSGGLRIEVPGGLFDDEEARILVASYDDKHDNDVARGENSGRHLAHYNVVRDMADVGVWSGEAVQVDVGEGTLAMAGRDGCAVLVQSIRTGRILGAADVRLQPQS